ncbi:MAG: Sir2 family NAD-dependent protein deacetylase [bacterium]|nr:Sir2 family NAD-dependent protein deacetylase [bacterium]
MKEIDSAARWIDHASGLVVLSGAGMGVDSGLPDFRGDRGFWKAYPMYERLGLSFVEAANPEHFEGDPHFGWGFYGHRLNLYRKTTPHQGYSVLKKWAEQRGKALFFVTSNVDGHFQKAGFDPAQVYEVHGSIHQLQCCRPCSSKIWDNQAEVAVEESTMRSTQVPRCPECDHVARPNILMFGDFAWISGRSESQAQQFEAFCQRIGHQNLVALEIGAGLAVPTIRMMTERLARLGTKSIRINPNDPAITSPNISIRLGGKDALLRLDQAL